MLGLLRRLVSPSRSQPGKDDAVRAQAPAQIDIEGGTPFDVLASLEDRGDMPVLRWDAAREWIDTLPEERRGEAWLACERAWLAHLRDALGPDFRLDESANALVLSSLGPGEARATLEFMERTLKRILHVLAGIAEASEWGRDILVIFDDEETYYRYVSKYHPAEGEFALSSGMHIDAGCSHHVTTRANLVLVEPVVAHEMTHGCVGHLPLPLWVNEGLAVNTEQRVTNPGPPLHTPHEMRAKHLEFWGVEEVQQFWSGRSFARQDDGNLLSYDLARVLVEQLSADWPRFAAFARAAHYDDGGNAAAREHLGSTLGTMAAAIFEREDSESFEPHPETWREPAEHVPASPPICFKT